VSSCRWTPYTIPKQQIRKFCILHFLNFQDVAISIAVVHHFSSEDRRLQAIQELFRIVRPGGKVLVTVWALEQEKLKYTGNFFNLRKKKFSIFSRFSTSQKPPTKFFQNKMFLCHGILRPQKRKRMSL
jgi:SAM-dependent methyltransferase